MLFNTFMIYIKLLIFSLTIFASLYGPYKGFLNDTPIYTSEYFNINKGESISITISKITNLNIPNKIFLRTYLNLNNINKFQLGEYAIENKNLKNIILDFKNGNTVTHKLLINEGMNIYQINEALDNSSLINNCYMLECIDTNFDFKEGILFPDTYFYKKNMLASNILQKSHNKLNKELNLIYKKRNLNNILNKEEILILASIIEKEAGNDEEKFKISSVFQTRLSIDMRLQADPTIIYGLLPNFDGDIKKSDILDSSNEYNTYMINGLPPTPISVVSMSSLIAAANAEIGEYLFFVADSSNSHYFSKTYDEHLDKIKEIGLNK